MTYSVSSSSADCLRKFAINFKKPASYKGEYGFSYIDPKVINKIVGIKNWDNNKIERKELLIAFSGDNNLNSAIAKYKNIYNSRFNCKPWGYNYLTTFLSLFPKKSSFGARNYCYLDLEVNQLKISRDDDLPLSNDGTIIEFVVDNPQVKVTPQTISISKLLGKRLKRNYKSNDKDESEYYYTSLNSIKIECLEPIDKACSVKIFAKRNKCKPVQVGLGVVIKNNVIKNLKIKIVDIVHDEAEIVKLPKEGLVSPIKYNCLNQALIRADVKHEKFILSKYSNLSVRNFIKSYPKGTILDEEGDYDYFSKEYFPRFKKIYNEVILGGKDMDNINDFTYLFRSNLKTISQSVEGVSTGYPDNKNKRKFNFKSSCMIPGGESSINLWVHLHELCHTLGLVHTFERDFNINDRPTINDTFTDNIMDYEFDNKYAGKMYSLEFWQWSDMLKDNNLK